MTNPITVNVIEDSISQQGVRLATIHARYPRMIHSEIMTHRVFSRNARSSRAVPSVTLLSEDMYVPHFMKNMPGMQAKEEMSPLNRALAEQVWYEMAEACTKGVKELHQLGVHKQWANRPLEWFGFIDVLISSTDWVNFFHLRDHGDAQPEAEQLSRAVITAMNESEPMMLHSGEWHLPYVDQFERSNYDLETQKKLSVARCARISYKPFDGNASVEAEMERYERLVVSQPLHASPAEHQASPDTETRIPSRRLWTKSDVAWTNPHLQGNFRGWIQYRKTLDNEAVFDAKGHHKFDLRDK
ncbi:MAG: FAD-dependent thymidylate synthase [Roseibium sp.]|nr:FAD-dependent thymidylate synthase [Roseibium sp.]